MDAVLLRPGIEEFLRWDYIGPPWTETNSVYKGINEGTAFFAISRTTIDVLKLSLGIVE